MKYLLIIILILSISTPVWGQEYFVRTDGNSDRCTGLADAADTGTGVSGQPCAWGDAGTTKALAKVAAFTGFVSGDVIRFRRGDTFTDTYLRKAVAGLTFNAYGPATTPPVITGAAGDPQAVLVSANNQTFEGLWINGNRLTGYKNANLVIKNCIFSENHNATGTKVIDLTSGSATVYNNLLINNKSAGFSTTGTATVTNNIFFGTGAAYGPIYLPGAGTVTYTSNIIAGGAYYPSNPATALICNVSGTGVCTDGGNNKLLTDPINNYPKFKQTQFPAVPKISLRFSDDPNHFACMMSTLKDYGVKASLAPAYGFIQSTVVPKGMTTTSHCNGGPYTLADLQSLIDNGYGTVQIRSGSGNSMSITADTYRILTTNTGTNTLTINDAAKTITLTSTGNPANNITAEWNSDGNRTVGYLRGLLNNKGWTISAVNTPGDEVALKALKNTVCTTFPCSIDTSAFKISTTNTGINTLTIDGVSKTLTLTSSGTPANDVTIDWNSDPTKTGSDLLKAVTGKGWTVTSKGIASGYYRLSSLKDQVCTTFPCDVMFDDHTGAGRRLYDESTAAAAAVEGFIGRLLPKKTFTYPYGQYEPHFINYLANNTDYVGATASDLGDTLTTAAYLNSVNIWKVRSIRTPDLVKDKVKNETNIRAGVRAVWGWAVGTGGILSLYQHNNDLTLQEMIWAVDEFNRLGVEWVLFGDHVESIKADHATGDSLTYSKTYPHGDYNLTVGSPAVDAAADVKLTADILGNSYLGMPDIGPYELVNGWKPMSFLKVTLAGSGGGTVSSFPAGVSCSAGVCLSSMVQYTQTDLNATPNPGSVFEGWSGACTGTSTCTLPVAQSADVTATFTRYFTMNSASLGGGAITQSLTLVNYGGSVQFTITPVPGSTFLGLTDNGVAVTAVPGPSGTFIYTINNVTADHFVQAIFKSYTINSTSSGSGSITQSLTSVNYGGSVQFTITPEPGSAFLGLTDNGTAVTAVPGPSGTFMYTISNVTTDHFVQADFSQITGTGGASPVPALGPAGILAAVAGLGMLLRRRMRR